MRDIYLIFDVKSVKCPQHMTEPKPFLGAMWVAVRIRELVMEPMYAHPIHWITLKKFDIVTNHIFFLKNI